MKKSLLTRPLLFACLALPFVPSALADDPLTEKTLIVYVSNSADSIAVKDHYVAARFSNPANAKVCPITLSDINAVALSETEYFNTVRNPVRNCLSTFRRTNILYIVLAYVRPVRVTTADGLQNYALDSYLADIWDYYSTTNISPYPGTPHRYYADTQNQGNVYPRFISFQAFRTTARVIYYSVWRLDGATPAVANGLVDKATAAMNNATGAACFDINYGDPITDQHLDYSYFSGDWDLYKAAQFMQRSGTVPVVVDSNREEFGTSPAPLKCPADGSPVAFYSGWYSFNRYNGANVFNWAPGAIGFHLDSASALDPRSGVSWSTLALANGITVTSGAVDEPFLEGLPRPAGVFRNLLEGANVGDAFMRNTRWLKWRIINIGDPLYRPFPATGKAPFNPPAQENSFAIATRFIVGGPQTTGTIRLATPAPSGGLTFSLVSNQTSAATVPATTTVPAAATSVTFPISTFVVTVTAGPLITANATGISLNNAMVVYPMLDSVVLSSSSVTGGQSVTGTVFLSDLAPAGGILVNLSSTIPGSASTPATVLVPAGSFQANFPVTTYPSPGMPQIRATFAGLTVSANLTVN